MMFDSVRKIDFDDITRSRAGVRGRVMMVFTYNIANGLTARVDCPSSVLKLVAGRMREITLGGVLLALGVCRVLCFRTSALGGEP